MANRVEGHSPGHGTNVQERPHARIFEPVHRDRYWGGAYVFDYEGGNDPATR